MNIKNAETKDNENFKKQWFILNVQITMIIKYSVCSKATHRLLSNKQNALSEPLKGDPIIKYW